MFWNIDYNDSGYYRDLKSEHFNIKCWAEPVWENYSQHSLVVFRGQALPEMIEAMDARKAAGMPSRAKNPKLYYAFSKAQRAQKARLAKLLQLAKDENPALYELLGDWKGYIDHRSLPHAAGLQSGRFESIINLSASESASSMYGSSSRRRVWISSIDIDVLSLSDAEHGWLEGLQQKDV